MNTTKTLSCTISFRLSDYEFELTYFIGRGDKEPIPIVTGKYDKVFAQEQIDRYSLVILDGIHKASERLTEERTEELKAEKEKKSGAP